MYDLNNYIGHNGKIAFIGDVFLTINRHYQFGMELFTIMLTGDQVWK